MATEQATIAFELYKHGVTPAQIAEEMGISPSTVRVWKKRHKWDETLGVTPKRETEILKPEHRQMITSVEENDELTENEKEFCLRYVKTYNATQSYLRVYGGKYYVANATARKLLQKPRVREEVLRLKQLKREAIMMDGDDVVDMYMRIAFADLTDYVEWGRATVPVMGAFGPVFVKHEIIDADTGEKRIEKEAVMKDINEVRFREHDTVDGQLLTEVKQGKDGASVKMADRMRALEWLANYFEINPADRHKREFDTKRLALEERKVVAAERDAGGGELQGGTGVAELPAVHPTNEPPLDDDDDDEGEGEA